MLYVLGRGGGSEPKGCGWLISASRIPKRVYVCGYGFPSCFFLTSPGRGYMVVSKSYSVVTHPILLVDCIYILGNLY